MSEFARMPEFDEEWGRAFTATMRAHMDQLYESVVDAEGETAPLQVYPEYPFCGCEDCDERERYGLAMILIIEGVENGEVRLV